MMRALLVDDEAPARETASGAFCGIMRRSSASATLRMA